MEEYVTRPEYDEHNRRTDDEHRRINRRMEIVEESVRQIGELTASVREMAVSMNSMAKEQGKMSERLDSLEQEPKKNWSALKTGLLSGLAGAAATAIIAAIAYFI